MGGPAAAIVVPETLSKEGIDILYDIARELISSSEAKSLWVDDSLNPTSIANFSEYIEVSKPYADMEEDEYRLLEPHDAKAIEAHFGFKPVQEIFVESIGKRSYDYHMLGLLTLRLAQHVNGIIDFCGALLPLSDEVLHLSLSEKTAWADIEPYFLEMVKPMPGKIISVEYETGSNRTWVSHFADVEFMEAWLHHPDFHMIK